VDGRSGPNGPLLFAEGICLGTYFAVKTAMSIIKAPTLVNASSLK
jgi:hypothetical protein